MEVPDSVVNTKLHIIEQQASEVTNLTEGPVRSAIHKCDIPVRTTTDETECNITGSAVAAADILILSDLKNYNLKVINIPEQCIVDTLRLDDEPYDIAVLPKDQIAVTQPVSNEILILNMSGKFSKIRTIQVDRKCYGIVYDQGYLYVVCRYPNSLMVLDLQGNVERDIPLHEVMDLTFKRPLYIAKSKDGQTLYISDWETNVVASLTLQGQVTAVYRHKELKQPHGLAVLEDSSLLVCCSESGNIHHISADLKKTYRLAGGVPGARSVCYHHDNQQIYVGSVDCDQLKVFTLK